MSDRARGYVYALLAICMFAAQDGLTKFLGDRYSPIFITMIRFWSFAVFVLVFATFSPGGLGNARKTNNLWLQLSRGALLATEIVLVVLGYKYAGLAISQAIFQAAPLFVTVLSIPILGETVGIRRAAAVVAGLLGVLIIINPVGGQFSLEMVLPLTGAFVFAFYAIATRAVSLTDSAVTSLLYTGLGGAVAITFVGPFFWTPVSSDHWGILAALCVCGALSHYFLILAYGHLPAVQIQPVTYLQLVLNVLLAMIIFNEAISSNMIVGSIIVVAAGLFTVWRESRRADPDQ